MASEDNKKAVQIIMVIAEAIRELKEVPSGHLYARVMQYLDLEQYNSVLSFLRKAGLISVKNHVITWIGEEKWSKMLASNSE